MHATRRHRLINLVQSVLLLGSMAAIAWVSFAALFGADIAAAASLGLMIGLLFAPRLPKELLLSIYGARPVSADQFPAGARAVDLLQRRASLPARPALYYLPSSIPNAFALGSPEDSAICVSDGLLRVLNGRELVGVLAHEVSHIANRDLWIMGLADLITRATSVLSYAGQALFFVNIPFLLVGAAVIPWYLPVLLILAPTFTSLLQLALSRTREFDADLGAARLTGDPAGLASALAKLDRRHGRFWEEILLPGRRIPVPSILRTHPPTRARVERLMHLTGREHGVRRPRIDVAQPAQPVFRPVRTTPRLRWTGAYY